MFCRSVAYIHSKLKINKMKITGEAPSAADEAAATFPAKLKKLIRVWYYLGFQTFTGGLGSYPQRIRWDYYT